MPVGRQVGAVAPPENRQILPNGTVGNNGKPQITKHLLITPG